MMTYFLHDGALHATTGKIKQVEGIVILTKEEYEAALQELVKEEGNNG